MKNGRRFFLLFSFSVLFAVLFTASFSEAQEKFGLGVILGDPTGFSAKGKIGPEAWLDGVVTFSSGPASTYYLSSDYIKERPHLFRLDQQTVDLTYGIGLRIYESGKSNDRKFHVGPKVPVGLSTKFRDPSVEIYVEASFIMDVAPSTSGDVDGGIGFRYWW